MARESHCQPSADHLRDVLANLPCESDRYRIADLGVLKDFLIPNTFRGISGTSKPSIRPWPREDIPIRETLKTSPFTDSPLCQDICRMTRALAYVMVHRVRVDVEVDMPEFSAAFKARVVKRLVGPQAVSWSRLAEALGVPRPTLLQWVRELRSVSGMPPRPREERTGADKLRVVHEPAWGARTGGPTPPGGAPAGRPDRVAPDCGAGIGAQGGPSQDPSQGRSVGGGYAGGGARK
jgi:transposase-like protein